MMERVLLCAEADVIMHPGLIGLPDERLDNQAWLKAVSSGVEARSCAQNQTITQAWVVSAEDIDAVNVAAALKIDREDMQVALLTHEQTGSLRSRLSGVDVRLVYEKGLVDLYQEAKRSNMALPQLEEDPFESEIVEESCSTATPAAMAGALPSGNQAFVLTVVSGSGGSGKSTVSALAGVLSHLRGHRTLLLDLDLQFGNVHQMLGIQKVMTIDDVLDTPERVEQLKPEEQVPAVLAAPEFLEQSERINTRIPELLSVLTPYFEVIIVNTGSFWSEQHAVLLEKSNKTLFLVDQRASSLMACRHAFDLCARCGIASSPFVAVINRCSKGATYTSIDVSCALQGVHTAELKEGGSAVEELMALGQPTELIKARNDLVVSLGELLDTMLPSTIVDVSDVPAEESVKKGLFGRNRKKRSKS